MKTGLHNMVIIIALLFSSCHTNEEFIPIYDVADEFQPYVDLFIIEANQRGHQISIDNLILQYDSTIHPTLCGACNSNNIASNTQKIISINPQACWANDTQLETLIFHELGHCVLGRSHTSALLSNGDPKSMMIANDLTIYSPCTYDIGGGDCNQLYKREYYLDELFNENTSEPNWAN